MGYETGPTRNKGLRLGQDKDELFSLLTNISQVNISFFFLVSNCLTGCVVYLVVPNHSISIRCSIDPEGGGGALTGLVKTAPSA